MKDAMCAATEMLLPELWQLANDCFSTVVAEDILQQFIDLAHSQLKNTSPVVRKGTRLNVLLNVFIRLKR